MSDKKQKIGLCLGGGAARGYALLPIIQNLTRSNFVPRAVSGCSVGALVGAYYCLYGEVKTLNDKVKEMRKRDFINLLDLRNPKKSLLKGNKIKKFLQLLYREATFDDLQIPLIVATTKLPDFKTKYITSGKLVDAVMASISIPGIFPPYQLDKEYLIDGQITQHIPYQELFKRYRIDKALVVDLISGVDYTKSDIKDLSALDIVLGSFYSLMKTSKIDHSFSKKIYIMTPQYDKNSVLGSLRFDKFDSNYWAGEEIWNKSKTDLDKFLNL